MAAVGFTPVQLYYSTTAGAAPLPARMLPGELAINIKDGKLYYEDDTGAVQLLASTAAASGTITTGTGTNLTGILKGNGTNVAVAVPGVDFAPKTIGSSILYGDGAGGFDNVIIGANLSFTGGVLSATGGGGGGGDVTGPSSAVDNTLARFDGTTGKVIQVANIAVDDAGNVSGAQGKQLSGLYFRNTAWKYYDNGNSFTFNYGLGNVQRAAPTGSVTFTIVNWPLLNDGFGEFLIKGINLAGATINWGSIQWIKPDGSYTTDFSTLGVTLTSGVDWILLWTNDAGANTYGKVIR